MRHDDPDTRFEQGLALQKSIFGEAIDRMYETSPADQIHIQRYLSANCFGDYQTRRGLDAATRELLTFATLVSLGGCEPQVKGHILGNAVSATASRRCWPSSPNCFPTSAIRARSMPSPA